MNRNSTHVLVEKSKMVLQ